MARVVLKKILILTVYRTVCVPLSSTFRISSVFVKVRIYLWINTVFTVTFDHSLNTRAVTQTTMLTIGIPFNFNSVLYVFLDKIQLLPYDTFRFESYFVSLLSLSLIVFGLMSGTSFTNYVSTFCIYTYTFMSIYRIVCWIVFFQHPLSLLFLESSLFCILNFVVLFLFWLFYSFDFWLLSVIYSVPLLILTHSCHMLWHKRVSNIHVTVVTLNVSRR